ncbi:class I SAM-dependent methyltransferase [Dongshaea marina]|uniref:class I SAM-dependent methyltransferase n=1 Tax=Dongshaea marina TaxID=2047966 RepID=UPI000D3EB92F|nr:class I SAM-dependent methyltransferase [Dongshaea marina]
MTDIALIASSAEHQQQADILASRWGFLGQHPHFQLEWDGNVLALKRIDQPKVGAVLVDLAGGSSSYRRQKGGGKKEAIARAVGIKSGERPTVVDATAGLARDAFVLASQGCQVTLIERSDVVAALLEDGLRRASQAPEIGEWIETRMQLRFGSSLEIIEALEHRPDVIYLDPMFPHKKKSAQVKKEMLFFQELVGDDPDADRLLPLARQKARQRVVVKRPGYAEPLNGEKPDAVIESKKHRFDIYFCHNQG